MSESTATRPPVSLLRVLAGRRAALTAGGVALGSVLLLAVFQQLTGLHVFAIPYIATAAVLALAPAAPLATPRAVLISYPVSVLIALAVTELFGHSHYATGVAVGLTVLALALLKAPHVPAVAAAAFIGLQSPGAWYLIDPMVPGVLLVLAVPMLVSLLKIGYKYPAG